MKSFEIFLEEVEEVIVRLQDGDRGQLEQFICHFLKGRRVSTGLGFEDFSTLCLNGERRSAQGEAEDVDVSAIVANFHDSKSAFLTGMPQRFLTSGTRLRSRIAPMSRPG